MNAREIRIPEGTMRILEGGKQRGPEEDVALPTHSEEALALEFSARYADDLRYVAAYGKWFMWDGRRWRADDTLSVYDRARGICRSAATDSERESVRVRVAAANTVAAVERLARADRRHAATVGQWDADPWLLNTPEGTVDLRTGTLRPARREDYHTKITTVGPGGYYPEWKKFLARITNDDKALEAFIQRMCGYVLTGSIRDHALFFLYGTGANGKSVFINTISGVLADYARTAPIETFIASHNEKHPTELAGLQGARLVTAVETEDGRQWSESKIKALTGGDRIAARFMRQDFFEFQPQFKLVIAGNHTPGLRTVDESIRRRFNLLPFTVTIPPNERDPELAEKLRAEWGGILQWMINGCRDWQRDGLNQPKAVREATDSYMESEDSFGRWIDDCCDKSPKVWTSNDALFKCWQQWCEKNSERAGSHKRFSQILQSRGFVPERVDGGRGFTGIGLREDL